MLMAFAEIQTKIAASIESFKHGSKTVFTPIPPPKLIKLFKSDCALHRESDEICLEAAKDIRVVLAHFAEQPEDVLKRPT
jgi:hypothetical protein